MARIRSVFLARVKAKPQPGNDPLYAVPGLRVRAAESPGKMGELRAYPFFIQATVTDKIA